MPTTKEIPAIEPSPELRRSVREKWFALVAFVVVTGAAALLQAQTPPAPEQPLIGSIQGDNLYEAYCASCHGADAKGNGPMAKWLKVPTLRISLASLPATAASFRWSGWTGSFQAKKRCPAVTELGPCQFGARYFHK